MARYANTPLRYTERAGPSRPRHHAKVHAALAARRFPMWTPARYTGWMARGFESKSVADQQEMAEQRARPREDVDADRATKRKRIELARADLRRQLEQAQAPAYREMLGRALQALDKELAALR